MRGFATQSRNDLHAKKHQCARNDADQRIKAHADKPAEGVACSPTDRLLRVMQHANVVTEDATADQEHCRRSGNGEKLHQQGGAAQKHAADGALEAVPDTVTRPLKQVQTGVIELDDASHQAIDTDRHDGGDADQEEVEGEEELVQGVRGWG